MGAETIKIAYNSDWPPYSYGVGDKVQGVLPGLMEELFVTHLGMKVEHGGFPWVRAQEVVKAGIYDVMVTFASDTRLDYAYSSKNVVYNLIQRPVVAKGSKAERELTLNPDVKTLSHFRICSMIGDGWSHNFYKEHNIEFQTAKDTQSCLRLVASGRMDVFLHMEAATKHNMRLSNTTDNLNHLAIIMGELPFTLLLSKKSALGPGLITRFDEKITALQSKGHYAEIIDSYNDKTYVMK
jgi:polar amino acid transport system substrate-binding protein